MLRAQINEAKITLQSKIDVLNNLRQRNNAELARPGYFKIVAPRTGIILSADFRETLLGKAVKPTDPLIRIGATDPRHPKISDWEIMLKIPQKHVGQVLEAYKRLPPGSELDVDVLIMSQPDAGAFRAKLRKDKIAQQAEPQKDDNNESEPVVIAFARIHPITMTSRKICEFSHPCFWPAPTYTRASVAATTPWATRSFTACGSSSTKKSFFRSPRDFSSAACRVALTPTVLAKP